LSNRQLYIVYENQCSNLQTNRFGVPQGSNLGLLLILIYIKDLLNSKLHIIPRLFADDTCLVIHESNTQTLEETINDELQKVYEWTKANKITINPPKSKALINPPKANINVPRVEVYLNNTVLDIKDNVKYLGITIDNRINFENHIKVLTGKISRFVGVINKLRHTLPLKALRNLYYSMVHPHLLYGIAIWGNTYDKYLKKTSNSPK